MKHLIIFSLLITASSQAQNQIQNETTAKAKKRPSWSQGLPERQSAVIPTASLSEFKNNKRSNEMSIEDRNLGIKKIPEVKIDSITTEPVIGIAIDPIKPVVNNRKEAFEQYHDTENNAEVVTPVNPVVAAYKWTPIKTSPIDIPENFDDNETLKLIIRINPNGDVTRVTTADSNIPRTVFKNAEKSILKWKFIAPAEIGINENISKTFTIDINTES